jgi:hypothetical protein
VPTRAILLKAALLVPLLAVGITSFILIRAQQGSGGTLAARQQQARALTPAAVDRAVRAAPDPVSQEKANAVHCLALGKRDLHNPWRCVLSYPTGRRFQYQVTISPNGSYVGDHELVLAPPPRHRDTGRITGCCVAVP